MTSPDEQTSADEPTSPDDAAEPRAGEVERVPLKVVPIFVQPIDDEPAEQEQEPEEVVEAEPAPKRRPMVFVIAAGILALGTVGAHVAAIVVATEGDFPFGTFLGYLAIGLSIAAAVVGIVALVMGRARAWAIAAILVAALANPLLLLTVLRALSGLQTT